MKTDQFSANPSKPIFRKLAAAIALLGFLVGTCEVVGVESGPCPEVALSQGEGGNACVMVFGKVGEAFRYEIPASKSEGTARCVRGLNAQGEPCRLPEGIRYDPESRSLVGMPKRAGFHEFVLLSTEQGVTRERVVLIDIQDDTLSGVGAGYASYFLGGVR